MLKFEFDDKKNVKVIEMEGAGNDILATLLLETRLIYNAFKEDSEEAADVFKYLLKKAISDEIPFITDEELNEKAEELNNKEKEAKEEAKKMLMDLFGEIFNEILEDD